MRLLRAASALLGRRLLITGTGGGVGHYVAELATSAGAEVTAVSATADRGTRLRELGADTVTAVTDAQGWFDVAMESVGGASFVATRGKVRPRGLVIWFGQATGQPITLGFFDRVEGGTLGAPITPFDYTCSDLTDGEDLATLVRLVEQSRLHPEISTRSPWDHTPQLIDDLRGRRLWGNAVLIVN